VIPSGVEIYVGLEPIDLRWGFDRLSVLVQERIGRAARSGALFVFFGKRKSALKILFFDGTGLCQFYKRLDKHVFRVPESPRPDCQSIELSERELDDLLDGIALDIPPEPRRRGRRPRVH
jgi:transposase